VDFRVSVRHESRSPTYRVHGFWDGVHDGYTANFPHAGCAHALCTLWGYLSTARKRGQGA
jgi:hypothetical protein